MAYRNANATATADAQVPFVAQPASRPSEAPFVAQLASRPPIDPATDSPLTVNVDGTASRNMDQVSYFLK